MAVLLVEYSHLKGIMRRQNEKCFFTADSLTTWSFDVYPKIQLNPRCTHVFVINSSKELTTWTFPAALLSETLPTPNP